MERFTKNIFFSFLLIVMAIVGFSPNLSAQQPSFSFQSQLSADTILIGDQVELSIKATLPKGFQVQFPLLVDTLMKGIEVIGQPTIDTISKRTGENVFTYNLKLTSFEEGYYQIPRFRLPFSNGESSDTAQTTPLWITVNTLPADSTKAPIYDIKTPMEEPITFAEVIPWVGGGLLLIGLVALIVLYFIKRKKDEPLFFPRKQFVPAHILALRELEMIKEKKLWSTDNHKHYQTLLTDVIRDYIEGRFNVPAMEQTTDETIRSLKTSNLISNKLLEDLQETLTLADLVKFARFKPEVSQNEEGLKFGFRFVNETMPELIEEVDADNDKLLNTSSASESIDNEKSKTLPVEPINSDKP